jgi:hypothetical protein
MPGVMHPPVAGAGKEEAAQGAASLVARGGTSAAQSSTGRYTRNVSSPSTASGAETSSSQKRPRFDSLYRLPWVSAYALRLRRSSGSAAGLPVYSVVSALPPYHMAARTLPLTTRRPLSSRSPATSGAGSSVVSSSSSVNAAGGSGASIGNVCPSTVYVVALTGTATLKA